MTFKVQYSCSDDSRRIIEEIEEEEEDGIFDFEEDLVDDPDDIDYEFAIAVDRKKITELQLRDKNIREMCVKTIPQKKSLIICVSMTKKLMTNMKICNDLQIFVS